MSIKTNIEWTDASWNPVTGCTKVSPGCKNCYAEAITKRFGHNNGKFDEIVLHSKRLIQPSKEWKKPSKIFVNSMSDLFHEEIPVEFLQEIFLVMNINQRHTFQILTKRPEYAKNLSDQLNLKWTPNIWIGVSIESFQYLSRVDWLRKIPANVKFLSCEPLLGDLMLDQQSLDKIDWVIAGGESGINHRPVKTEWVQNIQKACTANDVAFFFKQWGGKTPKANGRMLDGKEWNQFPNKQPCNN